MDEFGIIAKYFAPLAGEGAFGLKDDAAVVPPRPGHDLVVTTDTICVALRNVGSWAMVIEAVTMTSSGISNERMRRSLAMIVPRSKPAWQ